ncbi:MAG: hypothetical protein BWK76_00910 [Desulfobulbaceae bacterium A2]|nr:MAG: hypothetical protein BWK76_00910 [Desulfobulbaceae bacterium A2]
MVRCTRREALLALGSLAVLGPLALHSGRGEAGVPAGPGWKEPFSIVALPDTQFYSSDHPDIFLAQTRWIVENRQRLNIAFVSHLGDITDAAYEGHQWERALAALDVLDGKLPFGVTPGNHDLYRNIEEESPNEIFVQHLGPRSRYFNNKPWYGGASPSGFSSWQKIPAGGGELVFLNLDDNAMGEELVWAQRVLDAHAASPVIMVTHDYMHSVGRMTETYFPEPRRNSGEGLWQTLVRANPQIFMVLCGHVHGQGSQVSRNDAGLEVFELLSDYQMLDNGGNGFLRVMTFDPAAGRIRVRSWSPSLGRNLTEDDTPGDGAFTLQLDCAARFAPLANMGLPARLATTASAAQDRLDATGRISPDLVARQEVPTLEAPPRLFAAW